MKKKIIRKLIIKANIYVIKNFQWSLKYFQSAQKYCCNRLVWVFPFKRSRKSDKVYVVHTQRSLWPQTRRGESDKAGFRVLYLHRLPARVGSTTRQGSRKAPSKQLKRTVLSCSLLNDALQAESLLAGEGVWASFRPDTGSSGVIHIRNTEVYSLEWLEMVAVPHRHNLVRYPCQCTQ